VHNPLNNTASASREKFDSFNKAGRATYDSDGGGGGEGGEGGGDALHKCWIVVERCSTTLASRPPSAGVDSRER
jgi:hypothetical protein